MTLQIQKCKILIDKSRDTKLSPRPTYRIWKMELPEIQSSVSPIIYIAPRDWIPISVIRLSKEVEELMSKQRRKYVEGYLAENVLYITAIVGDCPW